MTFCACNFSRVAIIGCDNVIDGCGVKSQWEDLHAQVQIVARIRENARNILHEVMFSHEHDSGKPLPASLKSKCEILW